MREYVYPVVLAAGALFYCSGPAAQAADKVAIRVTNDNSDDVFVSFK